MIPSVAQQPANPVGWAPPTIPSAPLPLLVLCLTCTLASAHPRDHLTKPDDWYLTPDAATIATHILSHQSPLGGWPKNLDTSASPYAGDPAKLSPTFDNGATTDELRFLARIHNATPDPRYRQSFLQGLDYILIAQYPTGGWPQFHPPSKQYHRHITFNDGAMVRLMQFLREVATHPRYAFVDVARRQSCQAAFDRGLQCILKCQIQVNGKLTAWCAQHDEKDYSPRPGRAFEPASLSGSESVGIVQLLMSLDHPSPEIIHAIESAIAWFESAKLPGLKLIEQPDPQSPTGKNKLVIPDPSAPPLWARFYDIPTNKPLFYDRDGLPKPSLADLTPERRNGYSYLGSYPQDLLAKSYPAWKSRLPNP